jgi:hypothetical protein
VINSSNAAFVMQFIHSDGVQSAEGWRRTATANCSDGRGNCEDCTGIGLRNQPIDAGGNQAKPGARAAHASTYTVSEAFKQIPGLKKVISAEFFDQFGTTTHFTDFSRSSEIDFLELFPNQC